MQNLKKHIFSIHLVFIFVVLCFTYCFYSSLNMSNIKNMNHHKNVSFKTIRGYFPFHAKDEFLSPAELFYSPAAPTKTKKKENKSKQPSRVKSNYKRREEWSYTGENGPDNWHRCYPVAASDYQSPINIEYRNLVYDSSLKRLIFKGYDDSSSTKKITMKNDGYSVKLIPQSTLTIQIEDSQSIYEAFQISFHWGDNNSKGSEHLNNGKSYPMEVQIIHRNSKYTEDEMYYKQDGLLIVAFWVEVDNEINENYSRITDQIDKIKYKDNETDIDHFMIQSLLPEDPSMYFSYIGSLTTPPCNECVTWVILANTTKISEKQIEKFRDLFATESVSSEKLINNFRPPQRICRRVVKASIEMHEKSDLE